MQAVFWVNILHNAEIDTNESVSALVTDTPVVFWMVPRLYLVVILDPLLAPTF